MATYGTITLDGSLGDWGAPVYDDGAGHKVYARFQAGTYLFAATGAVPGTTFWLDSDGNPATGYQLGGPVTVPRQYSWGYYPGGEPTPFAGGAEHSVYVRDGTQGNLAVLTNPPSGPDYVFGIAQAWSGDTVEFAVPAALIGASDAGIDFKINVGGLYVNTVLAALPVPTYGGVALDGGLGDWSAADERAVNATYSPPGSRFFATVADGSFVFALKTTGLATAGAHILIDSDRNDGSGSTAYGMVNESLVKLPGGSYYPIAKGVDFDIRFDSAGHPQLHKGDGTLVGPLAYAVNGDTIEIAVPQHALGGAQPADVTLEFFNGLYGVGYVPPTFTVGGAATASGGVVLDGSIGDWGPDERIDTWQTGLVGYEIYGRATPDAFAIALKAPQAIGAGSTVWINTDADMTTGQRIWGFAGGAEYRVDFDANGRPQLFAADGTLLAANLAYAYSPDHTTVELLVPKGLIGGGSEISTLYDINDSIFLPTRYLDGQYRIGDHLGVPVIASNGGGDSATVLVAENTTLATTVAATDPDGGAPRYAVLAGADALAFTLDHATGALRFASAPDFEAPRDENGDNVYEVTVAAVDAAGHSDTQVLRVAVTDVASRTLTGTSGANTLTGGSEDDTLSGLGGKDTLNGMGGADVLRGGAGVDTLTGGAGPDRFVFASTGEIGNGTTPAARDVITDFAAGSDRVDLAAIDANGGARGNGSFAFAGTGPLTAVGQIHVVHTTIGGVEHTVVEGNTSGGTAPEFRLDLLGNVELAAGDFLL